MNTKDLPLITAPNEIPNDVYHNGEQYLDFVSSTTLKQMLISPLWMKYCKEHPEQQEEKNWATFGNCYHSMLSSIANTGDLSEFERSAVIFEPPVNPKTGQPYGNTSQRFKDAYEGFMQQNPGKEIYSQQDIDQAKAMIDHLRKGNPHLSPIINKLLKIGKGEISIFVEHKANDLIQYDRGLFKIRKDLTTYNKIIDWKTVGRVQGGEAPLKPDMFAKEIVKYGYDFSAAMYQYFEWMATGRWKSFYWVAQDKDAPYDFSLISADGWAFEIQGGQMVGIGVGAKRFLKVLEQYLYCRETDTWPGVSIFTKPNYRGQRISYAGVPGYIHQKDYDFFN